MADIRMTTAPRSDQMNADDLLGGERTFTIVAVDMVGGDQPVHVHMAEFDQGRPWKPNKTMRRLLMLGWGYETDDYVGKRITLKRDPRVVWAGEAVGGIVIAAMSAIDEPLKVKLTAKKGKKADHVVEPLTDAAPATREPSRIDVINGHMSRLGMSASKLLEIASEGVRRTVTHPRELSDDEADQLIVHLDSLPRESPEPDDADYAAGSPDGNAEA